MNGYHELDGTPCVTFRWLLTEILKDEWEFDGSVVSHYFAIDMFKEYHKLVSTLSTAAKLSLEAGLDIELPSIKCYAVLPKKYVEEGKITLETLEKSLKRLFSIIPT